MSENKLEFTIELIDDTHKPVYDLMTKWCNKVQEDKAKKENDFLESQQSLKNIHFEQEWMVTWNKPNYQFFYEKWYKFYEEIEEFDYSISDDGIPRTGWQERTMRKNFFNKKKEFSRYLSEHIKSKDDEFECELARKSANNKISSIYYDKYKEARRKD